MNKPEIGHKYLYLREDIHPPVREPSMTDIVFTKAVANWRTRLDPEQMILSVMLKGQVFGLLGVNSQKEIQSLIEQPELQPAASRRFSDHLALEYGIRGHERIRQKLQEYAECADTLRDDWQKAVSYEGSANLEMVNELRSYKDPARLLLLTMDGAWAPRARWDAKVKLQIISLAGAADQRQREIGIDEQFEHFQTWMNEWVWSKGSLKGDSKGAFLVSTHDPDTWACVGTEWLVEEEGIKRRPEPFKKKNHLPRRTFVTASGREVNIYITTRKKPLKLKVEKMLRKGAEDPATAVDDDSGFIAVVNNIRDARDFISHLIDRGYKSKHPILIEDVSYTLNGKVYKGNPGSSPHVRMLKFFIRLANKMRVECIIHTPDSYAESLYKKGVSHPEYEVDRFFGSGLPNLVYLPRYFPLFDSEESWKQQKIQVRRGIETPGGYERFYGGLAA